MLSDTGPGVPEHLRERIFDPFFTTKPPGQGTGLGLAISKSIIENQLGRLEYASNPEGTGASFRVVLPPAQRLASQPRLKAWWVGKPCAASEALEREADCRVTSELGSVPADAMPEVLLVALSEAKVPP